jgi:PleD family two-component response regulator
MHPPRRLLLVDGDRGRAERLARRLEGDDLRVRIVLDGAHALLDAHDARPDAIVVSDDAPVLNGYLLLEALRSERRTADVPVFILTGSQCQEKLARGWKAGADLCIPWGQGEADVVATLHRALSSLLDDEEEASAPARVACATQC